MFLDTPKAVLYAASHPVPSSAFAGRRVCSGVKMDNVMVGQLRGWPRWKSTVNVNGAELAAQAARWQRLAGQAMTGRRDPADGVRLSFRPGPGVEEELRTLVAAEARCCAWATWTVPTCPGELVLAAAPAGQGIAALHGMFTAVPGSSAAAGR